MTDVVPVDAGLFASLDPPRLLGSRCGQCATVVFPSAPSCPRCSSAAMASQVLADRGTVWSWTVQGFCPKPPYVPPADGFAPFAVGYVDLGEVIVEGRLVCDRALLAIGTPVRLVLEPVTAAGGGPAVTYAFAFDEGVSP